VGLSDILPLGTRVEKGQPIAMVHAATPDSLSIALHAVSKAYGIAQDAPADQPIILSRIGA